MRKLTPSLNSTFDTILLELSKTIDRGYTASLASFLSAFFLLAIVLIAQFVIGVTALAHKNFNTLRALAMIPKQDVASMKRRTDALFAAANAEQGEDDEGSMGSESVSV